MLLPQQLYKMYPCRYKRDVHWSITGRCNYKCKHCLVSAPHAKFGHPTTAQLLRLVEQMASCGIASVSITGGEPLIREDFWQIVDALVEHGIGIGAVFSNCYLVNDALLDGFEERGLRPGFQMSYDGVGWHDWLRGFKGAESAVDHAFRLLRDRGFHADAAMCLHRGNAHTIRASVRHLASLGVSNLKINRIQELGEWASASEEVSLTQDESLQLYLDYIPLYFEDDCPLSIMLDGAFTYDPEEPYFMGMEYCRPCATDSRSERRLSCGILKASMYIGPDGTVCPCMSMTDSQVGDWPNVFETPLATILGENEFMNRCSATVGQVRDANPKCRSCAYLDRCNGGCRASAVCAGPDFLGIDPSTCHFFQGSWYERFKEAYVAAGGRRGHRFSAEELAVAMKALKDDAEARELDSAELEAVTGGEVYWPKDDRCSDTFSTSPTENCWRNDRCRNIINFYTHHPACAVTLEEDEFCFVAEYCMQVSP